MFQPPPTPPAATPAFTLDWVQASRACPLYRAPWERGAVAPDLPKTIAVSRPPLTAPPFRLAVQRRYWLGPVPDFFVYLGFVALGGGVRDLPGMNWMTEPGFPVDTSGLTAVSGQGFPFFSRWDYPPVRVRVLDAPEPGGPRK